MKEKQSAAQKPLSLFCVPLSCVTNLSTGCRCLWVHLDFVLADARQSNNVEIVQMFNQRFQSMIADNCSSKKQRIEQVDESHECWQPSSFSLVLLTFYPQSLRFVELVLVFLN